MGRPRIDKVLPRYASAFIDVRGKERVRLRKTGWKTHYVTASPGTPEFTEEYHQWEHHGKIIIGEARARPGSFDDLIARFYRTPKWRDLGESTKTTYRGELERFRAKYGNRLVAGMEAKHVETLLGQMQDTPSAANNLRKRLQQLFKYANRLGWRSDNPCAAVDTLKTREGGFKTWQEPQIAAYEATHPIGTMPRLAFDLALYTAQRRSDICFMGPQHVDDGKIRVKQLKTGKILLIPIHPNLAQSIAASEIGHLAFIVSKRGAPFTKESLGTWFAKQCKAAGVQGYSLHGLRKAASRRMAELGLSNQLIKSITGHSSDSEVARYTRDAEQERMADMAMEILANPQKSRLANNTKT